VNRSDSVDDENPQTPEDSRDDADGLSEFGQTGMCIWVH